MKSDLYYDNWRCKLSRYYIGFRALHFWNGSGKIFPHFSFGELFLIDKCQTRYVGTKHLHVPNYLIVSNENSLQLTEKCLVFISIFCFFRPQLLKVKVTIVFVSHPCTHSVDRWNLRHFYPIPESPVKHYHSFVILPLPQYF